MCFLYSLSAMKNRYIVRFFFFPNFTLELKKKKKAEFGRRPSFAMGSVKSKPRQRRNSSFSPTKLPTRSNRKRSEIFESFLVGMCTSGLQQSNTSIGIINNFLPPVEEMANRNRTVDSTKKTLCSSLDEGNIFEARKN